MFLESILILLFLLLLPSISAIEYNEIIIENESKFEDVILDNIKEVFKIRVLNKLKMIKNFFIDDIWTLLWDIINDIIGAIVTYIIFKANNALFLLLIPPFVSIPLTLMMKIIEFAVYGAIIFDLIRDIINLIFYIASPTDTNFS
jgi:hypothetical protein